MPEGPSLVVLRELAQPFAGRRILRAEGDSKIDKARLIGQRIAFSASDVRSDMAQQGARGARTSAPERIRDPYLGWSEARQPGAGEPRFGCSRSFRNPLLGRNSIALTRRASASVSKASCSQRWGGAGGLRNSFESIGGSRAGELKDTPRRRGDNRCKGLAPNERDPDCRLRSSFDESGLFSDRMLRSTRAIHRARHHLSRPSRSASSRAWRRLPLAAAISRTAASFSSSESPYPFPLSRARHPCRRRPWACSRRAA